jgi:transcriptional regulator with XRE-family HTH domain
MRQEVYMSLLRLGNLLRERRGGRGVRDVATEIGVSPATLSRVESGKLPDLLTFRKLCTWLKVDPAEILEISDEKSPVPQAAPAAAVHLRADVLLSPEAAGDLAHLILAAQRELARRVREQQNDVSTWF